MIRRPPRSTRTDTLFPYTTLFRSHDVLKSAGRITLGFTAFTIGVKAIRGPKASIPATSAQPLELTPEVMAWLRSVPTLGAAAAAPQLPTTQQPGQPATSEERRVGKESVGTCSSRWSADHK